MNLATLAFICLVFAAIPCGLFLSNLRVYRPLAAKKIKSAAASVLIPARNEEKNLPATLASVLANGGVEFEVIVLDDHSTDATAKIASGLAAGDSRVRLEIAPPLPAGWCGKQHACHVLAKLAKNPLLVFMDADVRLAPDALARMAGFMKANPAALASGVPRQETGTFSERLLIPLIHFILLAFLPMRVMRRTKSPAFSAGCGQLFIARRDAYQKCGGHARLRDSLHDGVKLPRVFRRAGFQTDLFDATDLATCRMYHTNAETWRGLGKNATEGLAAPAIILPMTVLLLFGQVLPFWLLAWSAPRSWASIFAAMGAGLALTPRLLAAWRFRQSWIGALLQPVAVSLLLGIQWQALLQKSFGRPLCWKGRRYLPAKSFSKRSAASIGLVMFGLGLSAGIVRAEFKEPAEAAPLSCPGFELTDQFGTNHAVNFPRTRPLLLIVADRKGSEQIAGWVTALQAHYAGRLEMIGVADTGGAPGWVHGLIREKFRRQYPYPILLDWAGRLAASLHCQQNAANLFLLQTNGVIRARTAGACEEKALSRLVRAAAALLKPG